MSRKLAKTILLTFLCLLITTNCVQTFAADSTAAGKSPSAKIITKKGRPIQDGSYLSPLNDIHKLTFILGFYSVDGKGKTIAEIKNVKWSIFNEDGTACKSKDLTVNNGIFTATNEFNGYISASGGKGETDKIEVHIYVNAQVSSPRYIQEPVGNIPSKLPNVIMRANPSIVKNKQILIDLKEAKAKNDSITVDFNTNGSATFYLTLNEINNEGNFVDRSKTAVWQVLTNDLKAYKGGNVSVKSGTVTVMGKFSGVIKASVKIGKTTYSLSVKVNVK